MYTVTLEIIKNKKSTIKTFNLGKVDSPEFNRAMGEIADILYDLDMDYDVLEGDGDMMVDDVLMSISEEEVFEHKMKGRKVACIVKGILE